MKSRDRENIGPPLEEENEEPQPDPVSEVEDTARIDTARIAELERALAQQQALVGAKEHELTRAQAEETRLRQALSSLEQLSAVEAQAYVLALVCDRTPKAPHPDPALLTPS